MTAVYDDIGRSYDGTRRADPQIGQALYRLMDPVVGARYLDLACGTGNYTVDLSERGLLISGVDVSQTMLAAAAAKSTDVIWLRASVDTLPFSDAAFAGVFCTLAIHHFDNLTGVFAAVQRVLSPQGRFVLLTGCADQMKNYWLNHYFPDAMSRSIEQMPARSEIETALVRAGFAETTAAPFFVTDELQDLFLYSGKSRPHLYLDPIIRSGISTFAKLTDPAELDVGLTGLRDDIESGQINDVIAEYDSSGGDYTFMTATL